MWKTGNASLSLTNYEIHTARNSDRRFDVWTE